MTDVGSLPITIVDAIRYRARRNAAAPAIADPEKIACTYGELAEQIDHLSGVLASPGIGSADRVAVVASNGPGAASLVLAAAAVAACAPLNPAYTEPEFEFYLRDLMPRLLIVEDGVCPQARQAANRLGIPVIGFSSRLCGGAFQFIGAAPPQPRAAAAGGDDVALLLHTSGTTARPKLVALTQANLCISAANIASSLSLTARDRCLCIMPLFHIHGIVGAALSTFASGGTLVCVDRFSAADFFGWLRRARPTWYTAVPTLHQAVLTRAAHTGETAEDCPLRFIRSCSAPLPPRLMSQLEELFRVPVVEAYGMTEAAHQIACNPLPPRRRKPGSVGIPTGVEVATLDECGQPLPSGQPGEIVIRGPGVITGYAGANGAASQAFAQGWLRTGDLGHLDSDGYLFISGRLKEIINRGGEKIAPREVEEVLLTHPGIAEAIAFAVPDARLGEDVGAAIVVRPGAGPIDAKHIRDFAAASLAEFKLPRYVAFVAEIPKGATGKPQRAGLAAALGMVDALAATASPAPRDSGIPRDTEGPLAALWQSTLKLDTIGRDDDFFDLGGDSLAALTMLIEIEHRFGVSLTIADLLNAPTIARLARAIDGEAQGRSPPRLAVIQPGAAELPFYCIGGGPRLRELARLLGPEQPVLATAYPDPSALPYPCRLEDIARHHVETIRTVQRKGPYILGGWCVDGVVAYEVARQLRNAGELIALLVLFDASLSPEFAGLSWAGAIYAAVRAVGSSVAFHLKYVRKELGWRKIPGYLLTHLRRVAERGRLWWLRLCFGWRRNGSLRVSGGWRQVSAVQHQLAKRYRPEPFDGHVLVFESTDRPSRRADAENDWGALIRGRFDVQPIAGGHGDMFEWPAVAVTAETLRAVIRDIHVTGPGERAHSPALRRSAPL